MAKRTQPSICAPFLRGRLVGWDVWPIVLAQSQRRQVVAAQRLSDGFRPANIAVLVDRSRDADCVDRPRGSRSLDFRTRRPSPLSFTAQDSPVAWASFAECPPEPRRAGAVGPYHVRSDCIARLHHGSAWTRRGIVGPNPSPSRRRSKGDCRAPWSAGVATLGYA